MKSKADTTKEHPVEHEAVPIDLSSALPKETLDGIVEEALSIVIKTKQSIYTASRLFIYFCRVQTSSWLKPSFDY